MGDDCSFEARRSRRLRAATKVSARRQADDSSSSEAAGDAHAPPRPRRVREVEVQARKTMQASPESLWELCRAVGMGQSTGVLSSVLRSETRDAETDACSGLHRVTLVQDCRWRVAFVRGSVRIVTRVEADDAARRLSFTLLEPNAVFERYSGTWVVEPASAGERDGLGGAVADRQTGMMMRQTGMMMMRQTAEFRGAFRAVAFAMKGVMTAQLHAMLEDVGREARRRGLGAATVPEPERRPEISAEPPAIAQDLFF